MKQLFLLAAAALFYVAAGAQKTIYDPNAVLRTVKGFHTIKVTGGIDVFISSGDEAVAVSASSPEYRDRIRTEVANGILSISVDWKDSRSWSTGNKKLKSYVSFKNLNALFASGGSDVMAEGAISGSIFNIHVSGGSDFTGRVAVQELVVNQSGGSDIDISGTARAVIIEASGGSDFNGFNLTAENYKVEASGGSDVEVTVNGELSAQLSGASDLSYKGNGTVKNVSTSGASRISKRS